LADQPDHASIADTMLQETNQPIVADRVEELADVGVQYPVHLGARDSNGQCIEGIMLPPLGSESIRESQEILLVDRIEYRHERTLNDFILQRRDTERTLPSIRFGYVLPA
jgi:hypothetical protein